MGGGVLQLVAAKGKEDDYIYIKPQMTYFKMEYRRYTNFSMENIREDFESPRVSDLQLDFTKKRRLRITVPRHGDMLNNIYLVLRLPDIYSYKVDGEDEAKIYEFKWIKDLGFQIIDTVSLYIGKKLIDTHTGEWLQVWNELNKTTHQKNILNKMIGNEPELYDPSSITGTYPSFATSINPPPSIENRLLYIPLHFWFCRKSSNSLPLIALQNNEVELEFTFRPIKELYTVAETDDIILLSLGSSVEITQKTQTAVINSFTNAESALGENVFKTGEFFKKVVNNDKAFAAITWDDEVITWGDAAYGGTRFENGSSKEEFFNSNSTKENIVDLVANSRSFIAVYESEVAGESKYYCYNWGDPEYGKYGTGGTLKLTNYTQLEHPNGENWEVRIDDDSKTKYIIIPGNPDIIQVVKLRPEETEEFYIVNLTLETEPENFRVFKPDNVVIFQDLDNGELLEINWIEEKKKGNKKLP